MFDVEIELGPSVSFDQLVKAFLGQVGCLPEQVRRRIEEGKALRELVVTIAFVDGNGEGARGPAFQHTFLGLVPTFYALAPCAVYVLW